MEIRSQDYHNKFGNNRATALNSQYSNNSNNKTSVSNNKVDDLDSEILSIVLQAYSNTIITVVSKSLNLLENKGKITHAEKKGVEKNILQQVAKGDLVLEGGYGENLRKKIGEILGREIKE